MLGLFDLTETSLALPWLIINSAILGAVLGAAVALLGYAITHGRRSFVVDLPARADRYHIVVDADLADRAVRLLRDARTAPDKSSTPVSTRTASA